jgi:hypothetical protein
MSNLGRKKVHSASAQKRPRSAASWAISVAWAAFSAVGVGHQLLVGAVGAGQAEAAGERRRAAGVAGPDGQELLAGVAL